MLSTSKSFFRNPSAGGATDPSFAYVPLLLNTTSTNGQQNNTFLDSGTANGGVGFTITRNGTPTQGSITPYWPNGQWSNYFNGSSYLNSTNATTVFQFGSNPYTVEGWIYLLAIPNTKYICGGTFSGTGFQVGLDTSRFLIVSVPTFTPYTSPTIAIPLNTWTHFAIVRTSTSTNGLAYYINGVAAGTATDSTNYSGTTTNLNIGSTNNDTGIFAINAYLSNFRVVKGVAVYTGAFTLPTVPLAATQSAGTNIAAITGTQTAILTCQSNRFLDTSAQVTPATFTVTGTPRVQAFQPFSPTASYTTALYGGSGYFNGSTDYLSLADNAALQLGTGDFTIEGWFFISGAASTGYNFISKGTAATGWSLNTTITSARIQFSYTASNLTGATTTLYANTWYHVAVVRSGSSSGNLKIYLNGIQEVASAGAVNDDFSQTNTMYISASRTTSQPLNGYSSNFRVVKGTAVYTGNFTPPTLAPLTTAGSTSAASYSSTTNVNTSFAASNTSLLLNFTNAGIYDAAVQNNAITVGNAQVSTAQSKWSPTSMAFDGTGDYLRILPVPPSLTLGTSNFTIDGWVYFNTVAGAQTIFDQRPASTNGAYPVLYMNGATMVWYVNTAGQITSSALSTGVWYYFAVTRSASVTRMYINGAQVGSDYADTNNYLASGTLIGVTSDIASGLNGYLQDFRITRGVARTIATPTAAFPTR